jgi:hypothetical protein
MKKLVNAFVILFIMSGFIAQAQTEPIKQNPIPNEEVVTEQKPQAEAIEKAEEKIKEGYSLEEQADASIAKPVKVSSIDTKSKTKEELLKSHGIARAEAAHAKQEFRRKRASREIKSSEFSLSLAEDRIAQARIQLDKSKKNNSLSAEEIQIQEDRIKVVEEKMERLKASMKNGQEKLQEKQQ